MISSGTANDKSVLVAKRHHPQLLWDRTAKEFGGICTLELAVSRRMLKPIRAVITPETADQFSDEVGTPGGPGRRVAESSLLPREG
jgi:hypothetical protein